MALPLPHLLPFPHLLQQCFVICFVEHRSRSCQLKLNPQLPALCWPVQYSTLPCPYMRLSMLILGGEEQSTLNSCSQTQQKNLLHTGSCRADYGKQSCCHQAVSKELKTCHIERYRCFKWIIFFFLLFSVLMEGCWQRDG